MRLKGKRVVITAAASGMGKAGCEIFAREGATVVAIDVNPAVIQIAADLGPSVSAIVADLSDTAASRSSMEEAAEKLGGLDVVWNHLGAPGAANVESLTDEEFEFSMRLNLGSNLFATGVVVKHMLKGTGGSIIFTASVSGLVGSPLSPLYSAAKSAVVGLTRSLALRYAAQNIRVNAVCPGPIDTPMLPQFTGRTGVSSEEAAANQQRLLSAIPMGRLGIASDVAKAALFLASDDASFVTGVALPVDGGYTAR